MTYTNERQQFLEALVQEQLHELRAVDETKRELEGLIERQEGEIERLTDLLAEQAQLLAEIQDMVAEKVAQERQQQIEYRVTSSPGVPGHSIFWEGRTRDFWPNQDAITAELASEIVEQARKAQKPLFPRLRAVQTTESSPKQADSAPLEAPLEASLEGP